MGSRSRQDDSKRIGVNSKAWKEGWLASGESLGDLAIQLGLSRDQLRKIVHGKSGTTIGRVRRAMEVFGMTFEQLTSVDGAEKKHVGLSFNSRKGLAQDVPPLSGNDRIPYQNFSEDRDGNRACIAYMWTELCGDSIEVGKGDGGRLDLGDTLIVHYKCSGRMTAPNLAIHPQYQVPRLRLPQQKWLCLQARVTEIKSKTESPPVIGLRVGDAYHYQWTYEPDGARRYGELSSKFSTFFFNLENEALWKLMAYAPYSANSLSHVPKKPDFGWLTTLVLDLGFGSTVNITSAGEATVEIKNICLCSGVDFVPQLKRGEKRSQFKLKRT